MFFRNACYDIRQVVGLIMSNNGYATQDLAQRTEMQKKQNPISGDALTSREGSFASFFTSLSLFGHEFLLRGDLPSTNMSNPVIFLQSPPPTFLCRTLLMKIPERCHQFHLIEFVMSFTDRKCRKISVRLIFQHKRHEKCHKPAKALWSMQKFYYFRPRNFSCKQSEVLIL